MPTETVERLLVAKLAELRADNPGPPDRFRLAKCLGSIAEFPEGSPFGIMLYSVRFDDDQRIAFVPWKTKEGGLSSVVVESRYYEGHPDPPRTEPCFQVGDHVRVARSGGESGAVVGVRSGRNASDRSWFHEITMACGPDGLERITGLEHHFRAMS